MNPMQPSPTPLALFAALPLVLLFGCTTRVILGFDDGGSSTGARNTSGGAASSSGGLTSTGQSAGSTGGTTGSSTGGSASSGGSTVGSSGGLPALPAVVLLDAGLGRVFGPVAISATVEPHAFGAAKLVYSSANFQHFGVFLQALLGDGGPMGEPIPVAETSFGLASPAPNVAVAEDGAQTDICWEDYGGVPDPDSCSRLDFIGPIVTCASIPEGEQSPQDAGYSNCGSGPSLVFNPGSDDTRLFYTRLSFDNRPYVAYWSFNSELEGCDQIAEYGTNPATALASISQPSDAVLLHIIDAGPITGGLLDAGPDVVPDPASPVGLSLLILPIPMYSSCNFEQPQFANLDPSFLPGVVAAASSSSRQVLAALELDGLGFRAVVWQLDAGSGAITAIPSPEPPIGPIAAVACPEGFAYVAMTAAGAALIAEQGFDGDLLADAGGFFTLEGFQSAVTSIAVAPNGDAGFFLAVSSSSQLGVYLIGCQ